MNNFSTLTTAITDMIAELLTSIAGRIRTTEKELARPVLVQFYADLETCQTPRAMIERLQAWGQMYPFTAR